MQLYFLRQTFTNTHITHSKHFDNVIWIKTSIYFKMFKIHVPLLSIKLSDETFLRG